MVVRSTATLAHFTYFVFEEMRKRKASAEQPEMLNAWPRT